MFHKTHVITCAAAFLLLLAACATPFPEALALDCASAPYCKDMRHCAEADFYFRKCGLTRLDGDGDGIPCERLCGKTPAAYDMRRKAMVIAPDTGALRLRAKTRFVCGKKRYCRQMASCAEAMFYLRECGLRRLDGNHDGIPCNSLCRGWR